MPDYQKGKIYKLWSPSKNLVYYGSTTETISRRLSKHLTDLNRYNNKTSTRYVNSFKILECEDYKIELVEEYPCNNRQQLCKKEGEVIRLIGNINVRIAGRTSQEYMKEWEEKNKEKRTEYMKEYDKARKDKKAEYYQIHKEKWKDKKHQPQ